MKKNRFFAIWIAISASAIAAFAIEAIEMKEALAVEDLVVYDDALASGWQDWSYNGRTIDLAEVVPVYSGSHSIAVTYTGGWSGFQVGYSGAYLDVNAYDTFQFRIHGGSSGGQSIRLTITLDGDSIVQSISPQADAWTLVEISLADYSPREMYSFDFFNNTAGAQPTYYLDDILLSDSGSAPPPPPQPGVGPDLSIEANADVHAISPYIYGMNFASKEVAEAVKLPVRRRGGNSTTRFNWRIDVHNTGSDWYFENIPDASGTIHSFVDQDMGTGTKTILTMPLIGWTPKRRLVGHPYDCAFKVSVYGPQDSVDPWDTDCGNGEWNGSPVVGNDPTDTSEATDTDFVSDWIDDLTTEYGPASSGGVMFYNLDNEPMLWNSTHRDVHPDAATYEEIRDKTFSYGAAIKAADATALTLGPVTWGWCAYFYSAADGCSPGSDRASHGDMDFTEWYLAEMQAYEQANGVRILDYLDLHIYPQVSGVFSESLGSADVQAARLRSTRQLWDPAYVHEGWINQPVYLIPRMKAWVDTHYPGTKLAITEYNWGALGYMNGALAQADILGIFGREGLDLATLWSPPDLDDPGTFAFRMYRNCDGEGNGFGDTSVPAESADQDKVSVYAAIRGDDGTLTAMLINKTEEQLICSVSIADFAPAIQAAAYRYSGADLTSVVQMPDLSIERDGFTADLPAESITLATIPSGARAQSDQTGTWSDFRTWLGDVVPAIDAAVAITDGTVVTVDAHQACLQVAVEPGATLAISQGGLLTLKNG